MAKKDNEEKLNEYLLRRDFDRTPEPGEGPGSEEEGYRFVIQKHDATRLHFDLRLELDGVLKSWAVPKGPSLDPSEKRLAVQTEDHPLAYGGFEDVIPKGQYGAGPVIVWDRGRWIPKGDPHRGLEAGKLEFELEGEKLTGGWRLIRTRPLGRKPSWLLMKRQDGSAESGRPIPVVAARPRSVKSGRTIEELEAGQPAPQVPDPAVLSGATEAEMPEWIAPQLATLVPQAPAGPWLAEIKLDGYRLMLRNDRGNLALRTRSGRDWTHLFPSVARALARVPARQVILDGEVVVLDAHGRSDFGALQAAMKRPESPFICFAFDLLYLDGHDLRALPLKRRKALLTALLTGLDEPPGALRVAEHIEGRSEAFFHEACRLGLEGVICKRQDSPYRSGRTRSWVKLRCTLRQAMVVVGYSEPGGARTGLGALLLGVHEGEDLRYAGKVGTGFSEQALRDLHARLSAIEVEEPAVRDPPRMRGVHWVRPELVAQVGFTEWTAQGLIRHGVFHGLREDKAADEVIVDRPWTVRRSARGTAWVAGVKLTHADRVLFPDAGITKLELAETYAALADRILPELVGRPLTLYRCPGGVGQPCFFQKHHRAGVPEVVGRVGAEEGSDFLQIVDLPGLIGLVQIGALELHIPGIRVADPEHPDHLVMDLDPGPGVGWGRLAATALMLRERFEAMGLVPFLRLTGGAGLHVVVPLEPTADWEAVRGLARSVARSFAQRDPELYTAKLAKEARKNRVLIDWVRNTRQATAITSWSTRARPAAPIAAPWGWAELDPGAPGPPVVGLREALDRPDPWSDYEAGRRPLDPAWIKRDS